MNRFAERSLAARLGYLTERLAMVEPPRAWSELARPRPSEGFVPLGSPSEFGRTGPRDARWHIVRNVPDSLLFAEVDVR
ncbi:MAG: hypothetical protein L3K17_09570 [Thermoplasmata archaeon]|nr:hypothetical protein [Thermoplasmata archaeon]